MQLHDKAGRMILELRRYRLFYTQKLHTVTRQRCCQWFQCSDWFKRKGEHQREVKLPPGTVSPHRQPVSRPGPPT